jgi:hypothetical protein
MALTWALAILRAVPPRIWLVCALIALGALYHWRAVSSSYRAGYEAHKLEVEQANAKAKDRAETERRRVDGGDDSRVRGFDRD